MWLPDYWKCEGNESTNVFARKRRKIPVNCNLTKRQARTYPQQ